MSPIARLFLEQIFSQNVVLGGLLGALVVLIEARGSKRSVLEGAKISAVLAGVILLGWSLGEMLPVEAQLIRPWGFLLVAFAGGAVLRAWGAVASDWLGLPRIVLVLPLFVGIQLLLVEMGVEFAEIVARTLGAALGFYLVYVLCGGIWEASRLSEARPMYKGAPAVLISLAVLALAIGGLSLL